MLALDGTETKSNLGANANPRVSLAVAKLLLNTSTSPSNNISAAEHMPAPRAHDEHHINGGAHSDAPICFQEFHDPSHTAHAGFKEGIPHGY